MDGNETTHNRGLAHWLRRQARRLAEEHSNPAKTGLGFALGSFIGIFPSFLIGSPLAFFLAGRFGWNRVAAVTGTFLMNPVSAPIFYWVSTWLGLEVLGRNMEAMQIDDLLNQMPDFGLAFLVGNTLFALMVSVILGTLTFLLFRKINCRDQVDAAVSPVNPNLPTPPGAASE